MKYLRGIALGSVAALVWISSADATAVRNSTHASLLGNVTFSISVAGTPAAGTTFWVAHGPLAGRFGVVQLQPRGRHVYVATVKLPLHQSTSFSYLTAQGVQVVHGMAEPGGSVTVIRTLQSVTAAVAAHAAVSWSVPLG